MKRIALVGMPNTGKSALFNRLTGGHARVGNWPGVTVDLYSAKLLLGSAIVELIDLPGVYDLSGFTEDEQVTRHFLENHPVDLVIVVLNAAQIDRQLRLALEVKNTGLPMVVAFNMADEARRYGIEIDVKTLRPSWARLACCCRPSLAKALMNSSLACKKCCTLASLLHRNLCTNIFQRG